MAAAAGPDPTVWLDGLIGVLTALVAFTGVRLTSRQVRSQAQAQIVAVDAAAYERARGIYESALGQLERENSDLRKQRDQARRDRDQVIADRDAVRADNRLLIARVMELGGQWPPKPPLPTGH